MAGISFDKIAEKTFDSFKKITPALIAVGVGTGAVIFLPSPLLDKIGLKLANSYLRTLIGIAFIMSVTLIITILATEFYKRVCRSVNYVIAKRQMRKKIKKLSNEQKKILIGLLESQEKSAILKSTSGDVNYLSSNKFIYAPDQVVDYGDACENTRIYVPFPWFLDHYNKNPKCLG